VGGVGSELTAKYERARGEFQSTRPLSFYRSRSPGPATTPGPDPPAWLLPAAIAHDLPLDDNGADVRRVLERVADEEDDVAVLPALEGADALVDPQDARGVDRDGRERLLEGEPVGGGHGGLEEDDARLRHVP